MKVIKNISVIHSVRPCLWFSFALSMLISIYFPVAIAQSSEVSTSISTDADGSTTNSKTIAFETILGKALADSPAIDIADARVDQASNLSHQNGSYRYPKVAISGAVGPEHNDPVTSEESGKATSNGRNLRLTVTKLFFDGGSSRSEFERSKRLLDAAEAESKIAIEQLFMEVVDYYLDYWRFQLELEQAETFVATMQSMVGDLNTMYRGGAASKIEVDFARARLASARGLSSAAKASMNDAFSELEYLAPGLQPFTATMQGVDDSFELLPLSEYFERGAVDNSGFVTNQKSIEATRLRVRSQKGRYMPTLDFELSGSIIDDEGGPSVQRDKAAAKLLLSYTLYSGGERRGGVRRAQAQLRELEAERVQLERDVFRSIDQAYNAITAFRLTLNAIRDEIKANVELQRLNRKNLELGSINIIELIDVEERLFSANVRKNEIQSSMYKQYYELMIASGHTPKALANQLTTLVRN